MSTDAIDTALETNAYAISYRLLGDRPAARAVAGISAERLRQVGGMTRPDWMYLLVEFTLDQTVEPGVHGGAAQRRRSVHRACAPRCAAGSSGRLRTSGWPVRSSTSPATRSTWSPAW